MKKVLIATILSCLAVGCATVQTKPTSTNVTEKLVVNSTEDFSATK